MRKIRVALIEDDHLTRMGLRTALQKCSEIEWVGEASTGSEGLQLLQTLQPDVGIVDIGLPGLDGIELTKQLKSSQLADAQASTKVLILTLQNDEVSVLAAFAAGADSYCMKDISLELLLEALKSTQEGNVWIDPAIARIILSQAQTTPLGKPTPKTNKTIDTRWASPEESDGLLKVYPLTERELEVLQLIVNGHSNAEIAQALFITIGTVKTHVRNILNKLGADDRTQAAVRALRSGLVG
jgi:DNA-binding NarL/FixJ family response regulator